MFRARFSFGRRNCAKRARGEEAVMADAELIAYSYFVPGIERLAYDW
jgi:hypothetical protein